jgi:hypothetical protein
MIAMDFTIGLTWAVQSIVRPGGLREHSSARVVASPAVVTTLDNFRYVKPPDGQVVAAGSGFAREQTRTQARPRLRAHRLCQMRESFAAGERREAVETDGMDQRVGMPVD